MTFTVYGSPHPNEQPPRKNLPNAIIQSQNTPSGDVQIEAENAPALAPDGPGVYLLRSGEQARLDEFSECCDHWHGVTLQKPAHGLIYAKEVANAWLLDGRDFEGYRRWDIIAKEPAHGG